MQHEYPLHKSHPWMKVLWSKWRLIVPSHLSQNFFLKFIPLLLHIHDNIIKIKYNTIMMILYFLIFMMYSKLILDLFSHMWTWELFPFWIERSPSAMQNMWERLLRVQIGADAMHSLLQQVHNFSKRFSDRLWV